MTLFDYVENIPAAANNPSQDQPKMLVNTNSISGIIAVDHVGFENTNGGYHTIIHQGTGTATRSGAGAVFAGTPAAILGINQIFSALYTPDSVGATSDTQLFNLTGKGGFSQLTGNRSASEGWCWIGGILVQWGKVVSASGDGSNAPTGTVNFKGRQAGCIPFPTACYAVTSMCTAASNQPSSGASPTIKSLSNTKFDWAFYSGSTKYDGFYWIAVGV